VNLPGYEVTLFSPETFVQAFFFSVRLFAITILAADTSLLGMATGPERVGEAA
jgi:hypothetical protein